MHILSQISNLILKYNYYQDIKTWLYLQMGCINKVASNYGTQVNPLEVL